MSLIQSRPEFGRTTGLLCSSETSELTYTVFLRGRTKFSAVLLPMLVS